MGIVDKTSHEYHLTPSGWVPGTRRYFDKVDGREVPRPSGAVETWVHEMRQSSAWSSEEYNEHMTWYDERVPEADREVLRARFRRPFWGRS